MPKKPPMPKMIGLADLATRMNVSIRTIQRTVKRLGVGTTIGRAVVLTQAEALQVEATPPLPIGSPAFTPGNYFGKPAPKKPTKKTRKR